MLCNFPINWAYEMYYKKTFLILLLNKFLLFGQDFNLHPMVKSALIPGWGESDQGNYIRARIFRITEVFLWTSCASAYIFSHYERSSFIAFASEHAGINAKGKTHQYWVDIGNYQDINSHNEEHMRFREPKAIYDIGEGYDWIWDDESNRKKFENMRIHSDGLALTGRFILGAIVLNHIISSIDALYLARLEKIGSVNFNNVLYENGIVGLNMNVSLFVFK